MYTKAKNFLKEVWAEVAPRKGKVSWPDRKTVLSSTVIVFVTVGLVTVYIGILDAIFAKLVEMITKTF
jgi:preprotein translocase subunit SecE